MFRIALAMGFMAVLAGGFALGLHLIQQGAVDRAELAEAKAAIEQQAQEITDLNAHNAKLRADHETRVEQLRADIGNLPITDGEGGQCPSNCAVSWE